MTVNTRKFYIEDMIHARTKATFSTPVTIDNFDAWRTRWLEIARQIRQEFEDEGLGHSVTYVTTLIEDAEERAETDRQTALLRPYLEAAAKELHTTNRLGGEKWKLYQQKKQELTAQQPVG